MKTDNGKLKKIKTIKLAQAKYFTSRNGFVSVVGRCWYATMGIV
jgi:hypothetical protein